jgi:pantothenate kinase
MATPILIGADIGATELILASRLVDGSIRFKDFSLCNSDSVPFSSELEKVRGGVLPSVGSGAWRLATSIESGSGVLVEKHREPLCIWSAIEYLLSRGDPKSFEAFRIDHSFLPGSSSHPISSIFPSISRIEELRINVPLSELTGSFPILLVNMKTGSSFYRIDSPRDIVRVGGSSIGATTIAALGESLINRGSLTEIVGEALGLEGTSSADLLVEDIYGGDCESIGLPGSIIASCFGKVGSRELPKSDIAKSLLDLMCINTAQLTKLHAKLNGCRTAIIVGSIGESLQVAECIQRVLNILSVRDGSPLSAVFFKHTRYLGCLGALLRREMLVRGLSGNQLSSIPVDTATVEDSVDDETCTKLRISTPKPPQTTDLLN